jgi:hypothetical protein
MSTLHRVLGAPEVLPLDDAALRRLERAYRRVDPDPLFRRRLRGEVLNRYVAAREGHLRPARTRRQMGTLGRSVLYASLVLAMGVSAAGAAADGSLPGDVLYAVKLQLEDLRMRIAPPSVHDELAAIALGERVDELERLAAAGSWRLVPAAAARVVAAEETLAALDPRAATSAAGRDVEELLRSIIADAPAQARAGLETAIESVGGHVPGESRPRMQGPDHPGRPQPGAPAAQPSKPDQAGAAGDAKRRPESRDSR